ncbi:SMC-Scp complex subunit ScpB [bacterium]|nr:SMC-Scp complex subunit ScpB [bacterium]
MDEETLKNIIEALLFAADEPLTTRRLRDVLGLADANVVRRAVEALQKDCAEAHRGIQIEEIAGGFRLLSNLEYADYVEQLHKSERKARFSQAALETLAIVAYRQPIHRADIEAIRGVQVDAVLRALQERGLVRILGRAEVLGRPFLYGTTRRFLEAFGLKNLDDLPNAEELQIP